MFRLNLFVAKRTISTSAIRNGKRNFKKFSIGNKRGSRIFKEQQRSPNADTSLQKHVVRDIGYIENGKFILIPERIPDLIVPDLNKFELKPYVSYRTPDITQSEFTAEDLFNVVYASKIAKDFKEGKLKEDGSPLQPSTEEKITSEEAKIRAEQTGTDIF